MFTPKAVTAAVMSGLLLAGATVAQADPYGHGRDRGRYAAPQYEYARVVDVDPIVRQVRISTPRRECYTETRYETVEHRPAARGSAGAMILGGVIGAALGNQIGSGDGRRAATVAGAVIGTAVGHDVGDKRSAGYSNSGYVEERPYEVERCDTRVSQEYEERVDGYRVTYEYNGRTFTTQLPYDPGDRIRVRVDVAPAE